MDNEAIETTAAAWVIRRSADTWTVSDQNRFEAWLTEATSHRVAYLRLDAVWQHSARLEALAAGLPPGIVPPAGVWRTRQSW